MSDSDAARLLVRFEADLAKYDEQMAKAVATARKSAKGIQDEFSAANGHLGRLFGNTDVSKALDKVFDSTRLKVLDTGIARVGLFGSAFEALGPAGIAAAAGIGVAFTAMERAKAAADWALELTHASNALGVTTTQLQLFDFYASASGVPIDKMRESMAGLVKTVGLVESGLARSRQTKVFTDGLKITPEQLRGWGTLEEQLPHILDAAAKLNVEERAGLASRLKVDPIVLNSLVETRGELQSLTAAARQYGVIASEDLIAQSAEAAKKMHVLSEVMSKELTIAFAGMAPAAASVTSALAGVVEKLAKIIGQVPDVVKGLNDIITLGGLLKAPDKQTSTIESYFTDPTKMFREELGAGWSALAKQGRIASLKNGVADLMAGKPGDYSAMLAQWAEINGGGQKPTDLAGPKAAKPDASIAMSKQVTDRLDQANKDLLTALAGLTTDIQARARIEDEAIDAELTKQRADDEALKASIADAAKRGKISKALSAELQAQIDKAETAQQATATAKKDLIDRRAIADVDAQWLADQSSVESDYQAIRQIAAGLATTLAKRREIELHILEIAEREEIAKLQQERTAAQAGGDHSRDSYFDEKIASTRDRYSADRNKTVQDTAGPLATWQRGLDDMATSLDNIKVQGLTGLNDGLTAAIMGTQKLGDVFHNVAGQIVSDLLKIAVQRAVTMPLAGLLFGGSPTLPGVGTAGLEFFASGTDYASGGPAVVGENGPELLNVPRGSQIISNATLASAMRTPGAMPSGSVTAPISISIDARGAGPDQIAALTSSLQDLKQTLPAQAVAAVAEAQQRRIL